MTTVLLVDGSEAFAPRCGAHLAASPFRIVAASSAAGVRAVARQAPVDVVVIAAPLPDGDALALLEETRAGDAPPDVVVLAGGDPAPGEACARGGDVISAPRDATLLLGTLRDVAEQRALRRAAGLPRVGGARTAAPGPRPRARDIIEPLWLVEKRAIEAAVAACDGNINRAAGLLEVAPSTIYRKRQQWKRNGIA